MLKQYKLYFVRFSDDTCKHIAAVNFEHALFTAQTILDTDYDDDSDIDIASITLEKHLSSLLIYKYE